MVRKNSRLIAQGYSQLEGIYFAETFSPVTRLEVIQLILSYVINHDIILYQMDVNSDFLNRVIFEEAYVKQSPGFKDVVHPNFVFKLKKSLYGLKQPPRAWYERLGNFLLKMVFRKVRLTLHCSERL